MRVPYLRSFMNFDPSSSSHSLKIACIFYSHIDYGMLIKKCRYRVFQISTLLYRIFKSPFTYFSSHALQSIAGDEDTTEYLNFIIDFYQTPLCFPLKRYFKSCVTFNVFFFKSLSKVIKIQLFKWRHQPYPTTALGHTIICPDYASIPLRKDYSARLRQNYYQYNQMTKRVYDPSEWKKTFLSFPRLPFSSSNSTSTWKKNSIRSDRIS